jgi:hypothetical protein
LVTSPAPNTDSSVEKRQSRLSQRIHAFLLNLKAADRASSTISCYMKSLEWLIKILEDKGSYVGNNLFEIRQAIEKGFC